MKRPNLRIVGIEGELQFKSTENIFNKIIEENISNLRKDTPYMKLTEHQIDWIKKKKSSCHIIIKTLNI